MAAYARIMPSAPDQINAGRGYGTKSWITIDTGWSVLSDQFASLISSVKLNNDPVKLPVIKAYTMVFDLCQQGFAFGHILYSRLETMLTGWLHDDLLPRSRGPILSQFRTVYNEFVIVQKYLSCVFNYLNQFHVKREQCLTVEQLCSSCFHSIVFSQFKDELRDAIQAELLRSRHDCVLKMNQYDGDIELLKTVSKCVVSFSSLPDHPICSYAEFLAEPMLNDTKQFYGDNFANDFLSELGTSMYLTRVSTILKSEMSFFNQWLLPDTCSSISTCLHTNLLVKPFSVMVADQTEGFNTMFRKRSFNDLSLVYKLYQGHPTSLDMLAVLFQEDVVNKGRSLASDRDNFITNAIALRVTELQLIEYAFSNSIRFHRALHDAFEFILETTTNSAQLICNFVSNMLQSRNQDIQISHLVALVCCLRQEKDIFSIHFRNGLANRLLNSETIDSNGDKAFVNQLRDILGKGFTHRLDVMISDITRHPPLSCQFGAMHFTGRILTTGCWPQSLVDCEKGIVIPSTISAGLGALEELYKQITIGRRITWINSAASCVVKGHCFRSEPELHLSAIQAVILLLFNQKEAVVIQDLTSLTGLSLPMIKRALRHMCTGKYNILLKTPPNSYSIKDVLSVNPKFATSQKQIRIGLGAEVSVDDEELRKSLATIEEGRKHVLEACAVRIMKAKKMLISQELKAGIIEKTRQLFQVDDATLTDIIAGLIGREYLARDVDNPELIHYNPE